jgi:hypothetical protein
MKKKRIAKDFTKDEPQMLTIDEIRDLKVKALEHYIEYLIEMLEDAGLFPEEMRKTAIGAGVYPESLQKSSESLHFMKVVR